MASLLHISGLALAALALLAAALCSWRATRPRMALAVAVACLDVGLALVRARLLHERGGANQLALAAGLIALIALMIRFGLAGVAGRLVPDRRERGDDDDRGS